MGKPYFIKESHKYIDFWGKIFTSATGVVGKLKKKFDSKPMAEKYVLDHPEFPMTVEQCLYAWDFLRDYAAEKGTVFHEAKEDEILSVDFHEIEGRIIATGTREAVAMSEDYHNSLPDGIFAELILWNDDYDISGTSDIVVIETINGIRYVDVEDHKTYNKLDFRGFGWQRGKPQMMLYPIHHLEDCNWNHAQIQLSLYGWMLEQMGFTVRNLRLWHNPEKDPNIPSKPYDCNYLRKEVDLILYDFKSSKEQQQWELQ